MTNTFLDSLLWRLLLPVIIIGTLISLLLNYYLVPPLTSLLEKQTDKTISHTAHMSLNICEERLNHMLELRLEENYEMNSAAKKEAITEIIKTATIFPNINILIFDGDGLIQSSTFPITNHNPERLLRSLSEVEARNDILAGDLFGRRIYLKHFYFPFWRWHIISFISEKEYFAPIGMAQNILRIGTYGTMFAVIGVVILLFLLRIIPPLQKIIRATKEVRRGNFVKVNLRGNSEIEQVADAFDHMIAKLENERDEINKILEELRQSEEKYRILSENSLTLVFVVNGDRFIYANNATTSFFKSPGGDLQGKEISSLFDEKEGALLRRRFDMLLQQQSTVEHFELQYQHPTGVWMWLEALATVIPFKKTSSILIHAQDITLRKQMELEQESLRKRISRSEQMEMLGMLAGGVAHDLNNILGGIVSYPELLLQNMEKSNPLYSSLQTIHKSGLRAAAIVQDLLTLTRRGVLVTEVVQLQDIVLEYLASPELKKLLSLYPKINITTNFDDNLLNIAGSSHHISTSIMNLVTNAAESMPHGGTIHISLQNRYISSPHKGYEEINSGEYVTLTVRDDGEGIADQDLDKIFEPFYTKKVMGRSGTGLGMSVVWGTVKDHAGAIDIVSQKGKGTAITLYFPTTPEHQQKNTSNGRVLPRGGNGERILVVDDLEEQREIASSILKSLGYIVDIAISGEMAVARVAEAEYDLILLDMIMEPGMDGLTAYREIQKLRPSQKAVIASGFSETERVRETMALGAGFYLKKPYGLHELAAAVQSVLQSNRANQERDEPLTKA